VGQVEALAERWEEERFDLLQPDAPGLHLILWFLLVEQLKDVAKQELQLVGASSGSRTAAGGGLNFTNSGAVPAGDDKGAET
jgi:hypothetical protein